MLKKALYNKKDLEIMRSASLLCDKASCGYKVGCIIARESSVVIETWNYRVPGNEFCNFGKCIREEENLKGGKDPHKVCSIHAEAYAVGLAAKKGISVEGAALYVTTFPCVVCARLIAVSGIKKVLYMSDYMGADYSSSIFKANKIELVKVPLSEVWN